MVQSVYAYSYFTESSSASSNTASSLDTVKKGGINTVERQMLPFPQTRETKDIVKETEETGFCWKTDQFEIYHLERPTKFKVLSDIPILASWSLESETIGKLMKDYVVYVNEVKEQCLRFFWNTNGRWGWVSFYSNRGKPLLKLID